MPRYPFSVKNALSILLKSFLQSDKPLKSIKALKMIPKYAHPLRLADHANNNQNIVIKVEHSRYKHRSLYAIS